MTSVGVSAKGASGYRTPVVVWRGIARPASAEGQANARLIAAAPELLAIARLALKTILDAAEARDFEPPADPILIAELEAVIAKATAGETRNADPIHRRDGDAS